METKFSSNAVSKFIVSFEMSAVFENNVRSFSENGKVIKNHF